MAKLFADLPEALASTVEIAGRCAFRPVTLRTPILPRFTSDKKGEIDEVAELRRAARAGLDARIKRYGVAQGHTTEEYHERLAYELGVIERMKYSGYFLIVADFIQWAKGQGIPVGPGRGSGAGSLVAYALTITDLDPIRFGLLFERFLQMTDYDKLTIEVWTNGAISPADAIGQAAKLLKDHMAIFINFEELPETAEEPAERALSQMNEVLNRSVEELELSVRSYNCLKNANIQTIGDLVQKTEAEMLRTKNFGRKSLNEIKEILSGLGLTFGMKFDAQGRLVSPAGTPAVLGAGDDGEISKKNEDDEKTKRRRARWRSNDHETQSIRYKLKRNVGARKALFRAWSPA